MTQLTLFDDTSIEDERPLPLIIAEKWDFPLQFHVLGDGEYWYAIQDWVAGITNTSENAMRQIVKRLRENSDVSLNDTSAPYVATDGKTYQREFARDIDLYRIAAFLRMAKKRVALREIKDYLAKAGVKLDEYRRDPASQAAEGRARLNRHAADLGYGEDWAEDRIDSRDARRVLTDLVAALVEDANAYVYSRMTNITYEELFGGKAADLRKRLGLSSEANVRNHISALALSRIRTAELATGVKLKEHGTMAKDDFMKLVQAVAMIIGRENQALENLLGVDILTGRPLLGNGDNEAA